MRPAVRGTMCTVLFFLTVVLLCSGTPALGQPRQRTGPRPRPTFADVRYGPHERNVLDFWKAQAHDPTPLVVFIHGGGFRAGSKERINAAWLREFLGAGVSVAAINYRFVTQAPLPAAHHDARRAIQFLRAKSAEWGLAPHRFGAYGGSAGAQLCMWLALHDDMANPDSDDPVERYSTRLTCVATMGGQTTMDLEWWKRHIPGYSRPHRSWHELFGSDDPAVIRRVVRDISALELASADDPPIFMTYSMRPDAKPPANPRRARGWRVHHVNFGIALKEKLDRLGVEAHLMYPGVHDLPYRSVPEFLIRKLTKGEDD